jgi:hypothetical protein
MARVSTRNLLYDAYRSLGVLRSGQQTSDDALDDALRTLNDMVDAWHLERLMIYSIEPTDYVLTGLGSYTLGPPDGTLGLVRPQRIEGASVNSSGSTCNMTPVLTLQQYRTHEAGVYVDSAYPKSNVYLHPVPASGSLLTLYAWVPFSQFSTVDSVVDFPPGYARALRWNLALELAPMARIAAKIPDVLYQNVQQMAIESKAWVKSFNSGSATPELHTGLGCGAGYDICSDTYF